MEVNTAYQHTFLHRLQSTQHRLHSHNITTPLQYFSSCRVASSTDINISHTKFISPPAVIASKKILQRVTYNITFSTGHSLVPHNVGETILGTVSPYRTRAADVGNVKYNETEFKVKKTKTNLFLTVAHSRRLG